MDPKEMEVGMDMEMNDVKADAPAAAMAAEPVASQATKPEMRGLPAKHPFFRNARSSAIKSPTDQVMSPATQKIEAKRKHLMGGIKPKFLGNSLRESMTPDSPAGSEKGQPQ
ncbi:hypothetical protein DFJ73DRAFT_826860 [Zopfochytrium polystomum]|nr:hypothetical protein DFJ73DRAFT_826860 [Zopfochytrium polystomum]